jgi:S-adenosylmethionine:tRNA ribosyltransferase-isomerase
MTIPAFSLAPTLHARQPPEARGLSRDGVRLLVAERARRSVAHARFRDLPEVLQPGDLLVINVSATIAAALTAARSNGEPVRIHVSTRAQGLDDTWRVVELRAGDGARPARGRAGERLTLAGGAELELVAPYASGARLMLAVFACAGDVDTYLSEHGAPIRYGYVSGSWPLEAYQNVYATVPGSAEMPSAGRPFTAELITRLVARGVLFAPLTLHTGVSSPERHEPPFPEPFDVPATTARLVRTVRENGGRVIAVGTTAVRELETVAEPDGSVHPRSGWTDLVITPDRRLRVIDGLITGWHEPEASHLLMLEAVAGADLLERSYRGALELGYLWHEFGDSHLILP